MPPSAADPLLISTAQLAARLEDPKLVLFHIGEKAGYGAAHIPGARYVDPRADLHASEGGLTLQMLPPPQLRERLMALGVSDDSTIVVYQAGGWFSPATRVVLTLQYAGLRAVSLLDGGLDAWVRENRPVTADLPAPRRGSLAALDVQDVVVDADGVQARLGKPGYAVVDARTPAFYEGTQTGGNAARPHQTGHIAGAVSLPFTTLTTEDGLLKAPSELRSLFADAGVRPGDTVVAYCHIGQQATAVLFAARLLGHKAVLYDGSFEDWSRRGLPVEAGAGKKK
ncbi:MAG TPA: sulfurtransferase [Vicinamibacterales bacterium]